MLLYFAALLFVYCFALASPLLHHFYEIGSRPESGPAEQAQLAQAMRETLRGRLWIAVLAAMATTAMGTWAGVLPGLRPPR
jgi:hypothetical protein